MRRSNSEVFPFNPSDDITAGASYSVDLEEADSKRYEKYVPFDWIEVTNSSGYRVRLILDGKKVFTVFGRQVRAITRPFKHFAILNLDAAGTIAKEDVEVLIQKQGDDESDVRGSIGG